MKWTPDRIRGLMKQLGWTQARLAKHCHRTPETISRLVNGHTQVTSSMARALDEAERKLKK